MDAEHQLDIVVDDGGLGELPPLEEGGGPGGGAYPSVPPARVVRWLVLIALGMAIERVSMLLIMADAGPAVVVLATCLFLAVPAVAGWVVISRFNRARAADARRRRP